MFKYLKVIYLKIMFHAYSIHFKALHTFRYIGLVRFSCKYVQKYKLIPKNPYYILGLCAYLLLLKRNDDAVFVNSRKKFICKIVRKLV